MKQILLLALLGALAIGTARADDEQEEKKLTCPVSGEEIERPTVIAYKGAELRLCCSMCVKLWNQNRSRFAAQANHQLVTTGQARQRSCPFSGRKLDPSTRIEIAGTAVSFCCGRCKTKVQALETAAAIQKVFSSATFDQAFEILHEDDEE